jgi:hypothetical protein
VAADEILDILPTDSNVWSDKDITKHSGEVKKERYPLQVTEGWRGVPQGGEHSLKVPFALKLVTFATFIKTVLPV